jgi:SAM-dependent methyltransferase
MEKVIPWKYDGSDNLDNINNRHRLKVYRKFIGCPPKFINTFDVGLPNYISNGLNIAFCTHQSCDFNYEIRGALREFHYVTCFEIINHVMNPLQLMEQIYDLLAPGGTCYISCPVLWLIPWDHCKYNFSNYKPKKLKVLFEYAGFETVRCEIHNPWPWWWMFYGFRPFLRTLLNRIQIWELRKPS